MRKKLPIGVESFEEFSREDFYYADKTMFIAELLSNWGKVNLFTRPRRFGKSLNVSMLKSFLEIGCNPSLFDDLKISQELELCEKYMGQFPVIFISLKSVDGLSYLEACDALRSVIGMEALRFQFLADSSKLSKAERIMFSQLIEVGNNQKSIFTMSEAVLLTSLKVLSQLLAKHFERKVIILVDEYDVPLDKAFQAGYYDEMGILLRNLFGNALKTNESLYFAVLIGCLRISKESIFTGLNNLKTHGITDIRYDEYFGFTEDDVRKMLDYYGLLDYQGVIREWYDGYHFGKESVYCPWDVINYCDVLLEDPDSEPQNYWANTSGNAMVKRFVGKADRQTRSEIERLIAGETIVKTVNQELTYNELEQTIDNLWSVLFSTGYLTRTESLSGGQYKLSIPNREIRELFISQIQQWFRDETRADAEKLEQFCEAFPKGEEKAIEEMLNGYLWKSISIRDTAVRAERKENFYHGLLLGLLQYENNWEIESNAESGEGYSDILLRTENRVGVVIEVKYAGDGNLEKACLNAMDQINQKKYDAALKSDGMNKIIKYGIAFYKKNCKVMLSK